MPQRPGRPRTNFEERILQEMSAHEKKAEEIVAQKINLNTPNIMAFEAACLLLAIEGGTHHLAIESRPIFQKINQYARKNGPHGKWCSAREFLEEFIKRHAPGFDWREDARQGESEDRIRDQEDSRIAQERAEDERSRMSWSTKYYTPDAPDGFLLCSLAWEYRKHRRLIRRTWPTLRELNLATAIDERIIKKIIKSLRPMKSETIKAVRNKFRRRGALPLRYGPRLIVGVLRKFIDRLPGQSTKCPHCHQPITLPSPFMPPAPPQPPQIPSSVRPLRTGRRWEAIGTLLVIGGLIAGIAGSGFGWFALMVGFVIFIIGRFIG